MEERSIDTLSQDGGCLCFDFINTVNSRKDFEHDYLSTYEDVLAWCKKSKAFSEYRIKKLGALAMENKRGAANVLARAKKLREALYAVFSHIHIGKNIHSADLKEFNSAMSEALSNLRFTIPSGKPQVTWNTDLSLDEPIWHIMKSCFDVWTLEDPTRMKECERCGWLFLDKSKNKKRRWCNMQVCGSHDKALRYYYRMKEK